MGKRRWIARVMALMMLGSMALGSAVAQTQEQEVKYYELVGPFKINGLSGGDWSGGIYGAEGTATELCKRLAEYYSTGLIYTYLGKYRLPRNSWHPEDGEVGGWLACDAHYKNPIMGNEGSSEVSGRLECPKFLNENGEEVWSRIYSELPQAGEGCYRPVKACPAGTVEVPQGHDVVICKQNDYSVNDRDLCGRLNLDTIPATAQGYVGCDGEKKSLCTLRDRIQKNYPNEKAREVVENCIITHERSHADDSTSVCYDGASASLTDGDLYRSEIAAYKAELACLDKAKEDNVCSNADAIKETQCKKNIETASKSAKAQMNKYKRALDKIK